MPPCFGSVEKAGCPESSPENTKPVTNQRIDQSTQRLPECSRRQHEASTANASTAVCAYSPCQIALAAALPVLAGWAMLQRSFRRRVAHLTAHSRALPEDFAMAISFTPCTPGFAAECTCVDIGRPLTPQEAAVIDGGMDRYAVLVFRREAPLTTEQQIAFTKNFGELEPPYTQIQSPDGKRFDNPALSDISNLGPG